MEFQHGNDVRKQETVGGNVLLNECCALNTTRTYGHTSTHTHIHAHAHSCWSSVGGRRLEWRKIINFLVTSKDSFNGISSRRFFLGFFSLFFPLWKFGIVVILSSGFYLGAEELSIYLSCLSTYLSVYLFSFFIVVSIFSFFFFPFSPQFSQPQNVWRPSD